MTGMRSLAGRAVGRLTPDGAGVRRALVISSVRGPIITNCTSSDAASTSEEVIQASVAYEKVPISQLAKPNPKAAKTLNRHHSKSGLGKLLVDTLNGTSFTIIGDNSDLNWAVAQELSERLGWFATSTRKVVLGMTKVSSPEEVDKTMGRGSLAAAELSILSGLKTQRRVVIATMAGGAAADRKSYKNLWGTFIVRVDEEDMAAPAPKPETPERACHASMAEMELKMKKGRGFSTAGGSSPQEKAKEHIDGLLQLIVAKLNQDQGIVDKKGQYLLLGSRGDWPELQPEGWKPQDHVA